MGNADAIVIGSGVIGSSVAYNLAKRGASVLMLEEKTLGCGASSACDGFVILLKDSADESVRLGVGLALEQTQEAETAELFETFH